MGRDASVKGEAADDFTTFVASEYKALVRYAASLAGASGAEDLAQTALAKLSLRFDTVDPTRRAAWTRTVMARIAWRESKRPRRREITGLSTDEAGTFDEYATAERRHFVRQALDSLPLGQRIVLTLRYLDDLSERETAAVLGCSVGTVKSRASRGIQSLRRSGLVADELPPHKEPVR